MKIATLVAVVALASGTAFAAGNNSYGDQKAAPQHQSTAAANDDTHAGGGLLDKTKRALHRMGEKMRNATHRVAKSDKKSEADRQAQASENDTRSMGAAGSSAQDSARQRRMDDAYRDYQSKQQKR